MVTVSLPQKALEILDDIRDQGRSNRQAMLKRIATVSLASKLLAEYEQIAELAVNAVLQVAEKTEMEVTELTLMISRWRRNPENHFSILPDQEHRPRQGASFILDMAQ